MSNIFNPDSKFLTGINKIVDCVWLSFLWCLMCLPLYWIFMALSVIVAVANDPECGLLLSDTYWILMIEMLIKGVLVGPASSALYYTCVKVIRRERGYATRTFFHGFKVNFKTGAPTSLIYIIFTIIMVYDFRYVDATMAADPDSTFTNVLNVALMVVCVFAVFSLVWIFPILSRFTVGLKKLFKNAILISIKHCIRTLILGGGIILIFYVIWKFLAQLGGFLIALPFILPAGLMYAASFIIEPVLKKYTGEPTEGEEDSAEDQWYRE